MSATAAPATGARTGSRRVSAGLLVVALIVAGILSWYASSSPDGLERVAQDHGFDGAAREHAVATGPFADYSAAGIGSDWLSTAAAGILGVLVVALVAGGLFLLLRLRGR